MPQGVSLKQFTELEGLFEAFLGARLDKLIASIPPSAREEVEAGNTARAARLVASTVSPEYTPTERARLRMLHAASLQLGSRSDSVKSARVWAAPTGEEGQLLEAALTLFEQTERQTLPLRVAEGLRLSMEIQQAERIQKDDLIPTGFGYTISSNGPSWKPAIDAARDAGISSTTLAANNTTSRLVNYGALDSMLREGVEEYRLQAKLDAATSKICRSMNGRKFRVRDGHNLLQRALTSRDGTTVSGIHPWIPASFANSISGSETAALRAKGYMVPPFHPKCRTVVVRASSYVSTPAPLPSAGSLTESLAGAGTAEQATQLQATTAFRAIVDDMLDTGVDDGWNTSFKQALSATDGRYDPGRPELFERAAQQRFPIGSYAAKAGETGGSPAARRQLLDAVKTNPADDPREWVSVADENSLPVGAANRGQRLNVELSTVQSARVSAANNRGARAFELHHNHPEEWPNSRLIFALSPPDIDALIANAGLRSVYAHIDDATYFAVRWSERLADPDVQSLLRTVTDEVWSQEGLFIRIARAYMGETGEMDFDKLLAVGQLAWNHALRDVVGLDFEIVGERIGAFARRNYGPYQLMELQMRKAIRQAAVRQTHEVSLTKGAAKSPLGWKELDPETYRKTLGIAPGQPEVYGLASIFRYPG